MKTATASYQTKTAALWKAPAYRMRCYAVVGGVPSGVAYAFSRDFVTAVLQAQTGVKVVCLEAPQGNVQTIFPEQGQSSIGSFSFYLYDRGGEITRQIADPGALLSVGMTAGSPAAGGVVTAASSVAGYPARGTIAIDSEHIGYTGLDTTLNRFTGVTRGVHGTAPASHTSGKVIHNAEQLTLGTRVQLACGYLDLDEADFCTFALMEVTDIRLEADLSTYQIVAADVQRWGRNKIFLAATPQVPVARSQNPITAALCVLLTSGTPGKNHTTYDLGDGTGLDLPASLVDVAGLEALRTSDFGSDVYTWVVKEPQGAKEWLEREVWRTLNCVPFVTQDGKYSAKRLQNAGTPTATITEDHVIRVVGWRLATDHVINVLDFRYDYDLDGNPEAFGKRRIYTADASIALYGRRAPLTIESMGIKSSSGGDTIADNRALRVFERWATPPPVLELDLFYEKHLVEIGEQVSVTLTQVPNILTGARGITAEVFEVLDLRPMFGPTDAAGVRVSLLWLGSIKLPSAPSKTTHTMSKTHYDTTAPATPTGLSLSSGSVAAGDGTFEAYIDASWSAGSEGDMEGYRLRFKKTADGATTWTVLTVGKATTATRIRGLQHDTEYDVQVSAFDVAGNESAYSASVKETTPTGTDTITAQDYANPSDTAFDASEDELCNLSLTTTGRQVSLWGKADLDGEWDAGGGSAAIELRIYRDTTLVASAQARMAGASSADTGQLSVMAMGVDAPVAGSYTYRLKAVRTSETGCTSTTAREIWFKAMELSR